VRDPMLVLADELEEEFGTAQVFRPYRDTRFSAGKSPYKTYQGMFVPRVLGTGCYLQISADGGHAGGGFHSHGPIRSSGTARLSTPNGAALPWPASLPRSSAMAWLSAATCSRPGRAASPPTTPGSTCSATDRSPPAGTGQPGPS
jgi:hypothetical protein